MQYVSLLGEIERSHIDHPWQKLARALLRDALRLYLKCPDLSTCTLKGTARDEVFEAHEWLLDWQTEGPCTLADCCDMMSVWSGIEVDPKAIARRVARGLDPVALGQLISAASMGRRGHRVPLKRKRPRPGLT